MTTAAVVILAAAMWAGCLLPGPGWTVAVALGLLVAATLIRHRPRPAFAVVCVAVALAGAGLAGERIRLRDHGALVRWAAEGSAATVAATVVTEPRDTDFGAWLIVRVRAIDDLGVRERALLHVDGGQRSLAVGQPLVFRGRALPLDTDGFSAHVRRLGAAVALRPSGGVTVAGDAGWLLRTSTVVRDRMGAAARKGLAQDHAALLAGLVTGDRRGRSDERHTQFVAAGLSHLVVVSGKHVGVVLAGIFLLSALGGVGARGRRGLALAALSWFVILVRWQPSVLRAGLMAGLVLSAELLGRGHSAVRVLATTVLVLLLVDPLLAGQLGFVLSVLATGGVLVTAPRVAQRCPGPRPLRYLAAATIGAQLAVAPVLLAMEGSVPLAALPANLLAAPAATVAQSIGLVAALVAQVSVDAGAWVAGLAWPPLSAVLWAAETFADGPLLRPAHLLAPWLLCGLTAWVLRHRAPRAAVCIAAIAVLLRALPGPSAPPPPYLQATAFDVGQGDALLVEAPAGADGRAARMLIDGGPLPDSAAALLRERGVRRVDAVVLSHDHADHSAGLPAVVRGLAVGAVVVAADLLVGDDPGVLIGTARRYDVPVLPVHAGDAFRLGAATVDVLGPASDGRLGAANDESLVLRVTGAHGSILLTGDAEAAAQWPLLRRPDRLRADVLKVPHHGGATNAAGFVEAVNPQVAVISVGAGNDYGHPYLAR